MIDNSQDIETAQMARWMDKENVIYIYIYIYIYIMEYYSALKNKGNPTICDNMDETRGHYAKWNKSIIGQMCMIPPIWGI